MKRQFTLLLASVLVVFALTACGGNDKDTNQDNNGQNTVGEDIQNAGEDIMDAGEDILDPDNNNSNKDNGTGDHKNDQNTTDRGDSALTGGDTTVEDAVTKQNSRPGVSYGQMLRNARVHDSDGPLKSRLRPHRINTDREAFCLLEQEDGAQKTHRAAATAAALSFSERAWEGPCLFQGTWYNKAKHTFRGKGAAMSTVKEPLHPLRTARYLWLGILLCALVGGACFLGGRWSAGRSETAKIDTVVLQNQLSEIRELATVTYAYTNMAQFESSNDFYGVKIPFTTKSFILTYDGTVKAGVDLDGAEVSVSGTTVTITLPEAEILSHEIDEDSMEVFDEKTSIFNPFTVEDFTSFQSDQKAAMEEKALSRGLLAEARAKAVSSVEQLFAAALPDTYTVTVH